jgi:hypothetical protein
MEKVRIRRGEEVRTYTPSNRGMTKEKLKLNKSGRVVSEKKSEVASAKYNEDGNKFKFAIENCFPEQELIHNAAPLTPVNIPTPMTPRTPPPKDTVQYQVGRKTVNKKNTKSKDGPRKPTERIDPKTNSTSPQFPREQSIEVPIPFKEWLTQEKKVVVPIAGDGNCMFTAVAEALKSKTVGLKKNLTGKIIRQQSIANMKEDNGLQKFVKQFLADGETFTKYCTRMKKDGEYGDQIALIAIACMFDISIAVFIDNQNDPFDKFVNNCKKTPDGVFLPSIELLFTPFDSDNVNGSGHYELILDQKLEKYKKARENALDNNLLEFPFKNMRYERPNVETRTFKQKEPAQVKWID